MEGEGEGLTKDGGGNSYGEDAEHELRYHASFVCDGINSPSGSWTKK